LHPGFVRAILSAMRCSKLAVLLAVSCCLLTGGSLYAQVKVKLSTNRQNFLLFEPANFTVTVTNESSNPIDFQNRESQTWLTFVIIRENNARVRSDISFSPQNRLLQSGESMSLQVNITPYYLIRETGQYKIHAVVRVPGSDPVMTENLVFNIGRGETVWTKTRTLNDKQRVYTLVRFLDTDTAKLYLRVEEPEENIVYSTSELGPMLASTAPSVLFDAGGDIHVLHILAAKSYRYTVADGLGKVTQQTDRYSSASVPQIVARDGGTVDLIGGATLKETTREKLSIGQGSAPMPQQ
jgi:hypothetical protein